MRNLIISLARDEQGQGLIEYALLLAFVSVCLAAVSVSDIALVVIVALVIVIIGLLRGLLRRYASVVEVLDKRFAAGELSIEEYQEGKLMLARKFHASCAKDLLIRLHPFKSRVGAYKHKFYFVVAEGGMPSRAIPH